MCKSTISETYTIAIVCTNCGYEKATEIPQGTTVKDFCSKTLCPHCGCKNLVQSHDKKVWKGNY